MRLDATARARIDSACAAIVGAAHGRPGAPMCYSMPAPDMATADCSGERPTLVYDAPALRTPAQRRAWEQERPAGLSMGSLCGRAVVENAPAWELFTVTEAEKALKAYLRQIRAEFCDGYYTDSRQAIGLVLERARNAKTAN